MRRQRDPPVGDLGRGEVWCRQLRRLRACIDVREPGGDPRVDRGGQRDDLGGVARRLRHPARQSRGLGDALKPRADGIGRLAHHPGETADPQGRHPYPREGPLGGGTAPVPEAGSRGAQLLVRPVEVVSETEQSLDAVRAGPGVPPLGRAVRPRSYRPPPVPLEPGGGRLLDGPVVARRRRQRASELGQLGGCRSDRRGSRAAAVSAAASAVRDPAARRRCARAPGEARPRRRPAPNAGRRRSGRRPRGRAAPRATRAWRRH